MPLTHLNLNDLKPSSVNVRKKDSKAIGDLLPSIRSLGILQPLLVRPNCQGYEIVAGQHRYHALTVLAEDGEIEPVPCIVMDDGDDAKAIEASLAENIARLPSGTVNRCGREALLPIVEATPVLSEEIFPVPRQTAAVIAPEHGSKIHKPLPGQFRHIARHGVLQE